MLKRSPKTEDNDLIAKETITLTTVFVIVGILFATLIFSLIFFRYSEASPFARFYQKKQVAENLSNYLANQTNEKKSGQSIDIKITGDQLSSAICLSCASFPLRKAVLSINQTGVVLTGKTSPYFWGVGIEADLKPIISQGRLDFQISEVKAAGVTAPPQIADNLKTVLLALFANATPNLNTIKFENVYSMVGYLELEGIRQ